MSVHKNMKKISNGNMPPRRLRYLIELIQTLYLNPLLNLFNRALNLFSQSILASFNKKTKKNMFTITSIIVFLKLFSTFCIYFPFATMLFLKQIYLYAYCTEFWQKKSRHLEFKTDYIWEAHPIEDIFYFFFFAKRYSLLRL